ncbi:MAG: hypothetical protein LDL41_07530 [Coleofasciculus sp. S288]|nr:hypothetical protein [Coleofasciculus sp. S288]
MTDQEISELRERINEVEDDFSRRANLLLDEILLLRDETERNARATEQNTRAIGELTERINQVDGQIEDLTESVQQLTQNANADRAIMLQILEYLRNQYPGNGR